MSNAAILASFAWQAAYSLAAPTPNTTVTPVAGLGWRKEPKGRGTFSIILTSVLTLGLCVWTAIHPNVRPGASAWQRVKHRLLFVVIGMLAPEVVLAVAFYQWREAQKFHREWCKLYGIEPGSKGDTLRMKGAFFVTMGGVSVTPVSIGAPGGVKTILSADAYLTLARTKTGWQYDAEEKNESQGAAVVEAAKTTGAVLELVELDRSKPVHQGEGEGEEPIAAAPAGTQGEDLEQAEREKGEEVVSAEEREVIVEGDGEEMIIRKSFVHWSDVEDKGKAEMLGKTLVCLQALWMLVQCAVRKASGLPVTLLEIHVAMHVVCAIGMYAFWFNKPQDVGQPIALSINSNPAQLCIEVVHQNRDGNLKVRMDGDRRGEEGLYGGLKAKDFTPIQPLPTTESAIFLGYNRKQKPHAAPHPGGPACLAVPHRHVLDLGPVRIYNSWGQNYPMSSDELAFFRHAADAYKAGRRPKLPPVDLVRHASAGDAFDVIENVGISNMSPAIFILLLYGACHAAAWNTHFPSPVECLLWRISSVVIAVIPAYALFLRALYNRQQALYMSSHGSTLYLVFTLCIHDLVHAMRRIDVPYTHADLEDILQILVILMFILPVFCGRSYLFVESFLSLRSLPFGSYDSTPWEDYFPHF